MYTVKFSRPAEKDYIKLPRDIAERVDKAIKPLAEEPHPANCKTAISTVFVLETTEFYTKSKKIL